MIIIGTGSREWENIFPIRKVIMDIKEEFPFFSYYHGAQRGFDIKSAIELRRLNHPHIKSFPYRSEFGKAGGMIRNREMLADALLNESPENILLIAMPLENSIGTYGMMSICKQANIQIRVYDKEGNLING